jgi:hypothetical protein
VVHSAAKQGRDAEELVQDVLARYLADEARFLNARLPSIAGSID